MSTNHQEKGRRSTPKTELDIDRRKTHENSRRDESRRVWLEEAYEHIYLPAYMNMFHPHFESRIHAFSNHAADPSPAEWQVHALAESDAQEKKTPRTVREFAREMIQKGLVQDEQGRKVEASSTNQWDASHLILKSA